jgi:hypothetical protein
MYASPGQTRPPQWRLGLSNFPEKLENFPFDNPSGDRGSHLSRAPNPLTGPAPSGTRNAPGT